MIISDTPFRLSRKRTRAMQYAAASEIEYSQYINSVHFKKEGHSMKKILISIACIFLITVVWTGLSAGSGEDTGKNLYAGKCQICHGVKGDGKGSAAAYLSTKPADFTSPKFWETHNDKEISDAIVNGRGEMPAFDLKPDDTKAVIDYITHAFKPQKN
jgi:cytochrome c5